MWRGGLLPLSCEADPKPDSPFLPDIAHAPNYDGCVVEREQAVSPRVRVSRPTGRLWLVKLLPRVGLSLSKFSTRVSQPRRYV
ncbi:hypothetical protein CLU80_0269 [Pseudomonas sp. 29]|nr:hypothetical protein CLU80_0269 [Pseudomonas sp. 29]